MLSLPVNSIPMIVAVGGVLGVRHAFEPDHLAAVSTLATRPAARLWSAARLGLVWGLGDTVMVGAVALLIIALGVRLPDRFWPAAELLVAALLVLLGGVVIWRYARGRWHMHTHTSLPAHIFICTAMPVARITATATPEATPGARWASGLRTVWRAVARLRRCWWLRRPMRRRVSPTSPRSEPGRSSGCWGCR